MNGGAGRGLAMVFSLEMLKTAVIVLKYLEHVKDQSV